VTVRPAGSQAWEPARLQQDLREGDAVQTGPVSRAAILCVDESQIKLNENTLLVLNSVAPSPRLGWGAAVPAAARPRPVCTRSPKGRSGSETAMKNSALNWKPRP
jgi:hypothetical protein